MTLTEPTRIIFRKAHVTEREAVLSTFSTATRNYLLDVEAADQQTLEPEVLKVMGQFAEYRIPLGGACCLMAGARTLAGALVPMVGETPTNVGPFVSGDYDRTTGLVGDGIGKYLNSNRASNADPQDSKHVSVFVSDLRVRIYNPLVGTSRQDPGHTLLAYGFDSQPTRLRSSVNSRYADIVAILTFPSFIGTSRSGSTSWTLRSANSNSVPTLPGPTTSNTPVSDNIRIFNGLAGPCDARLSYYSIGPAVDLAAMDTAITTCMNALAAAGI